MCTRTGRATVLEFLIPCSAQAHRSIRYITNKPKLNVTEANFTGGYGVTAARSQHGCHRSSQPPLIADKLQCARYL